MKKNDFFLALMLTIAALAVGQNSAWAQSLETYSITKAFFNGMNYSPDPVSSDDTYNYYAAGTVITLSPTDAHKVITSVTPNTLSPVVASNMRSVTITMPAQDITSAQVNKESAYAVTMPDGFSLKEGTGTKPHIFYNEGNVYYCRYVDKWTWYTIVAPFGYAIKSATYNGEATSVSLSGNNGFYLKTTDADVTATTTDLFGIAGGGKGTSTNPYVITTPDGLNLLAGYERNQTLNKYFELGNDITYTPNGNETENNFDGIKEFGGSFDGKGHTISGIRIYQNGTYHGLFEIINGGTVKNIVLSDASIHAPSTVGGIVGEMYSGTLQNCLVLNSIVTETDDDNKKGVIAGNFNDISSCSNNLYRNCTVNGNSLGVGALSSDQVWACSGHTVTLPDGATASSVKSFTYKGTTYHGSLENTVTLTYANPPAGQAAMFTVTNADDASFVAQTSRTFTMPVADVSVSIELRPCYAINLPDGVVATGSSATIGNNEYYLDGTTVTLSYPNLSEGYKVVYAVNGLPIAGNTFMMTGNATVTVTTTDVWGVAGGADGTSEATAYVITAPDGLNLLAKKVNAIGGYDQNNYEGQYFVLAGDIAYNPAALDANGDNYTPIGNSSHKFKGTFDGQGYTISGIRTNQGSADYQGLFGYIDDGGTVKNVHVSDMRITGKQYVGGIAGRNDGILCNCSSAATLTVKDGVTDCYYFGGIVGSQGNGLMRNNLAVGCVVPAVIGAGAIVGINDNNTLANNYYSNCTVGTANSGIGVGGDSNSNPHDITDNDGAVPGTLHTLTLGNGISAICCQKPHGNGIYSVVDGSIVALSYSGTVLENQIVVFSLNGMELGGNYFTMPAGNATVSASLSTIWGGGMGTSDNPYIIAHNTELDQLAQRVNSGETYSGKFFVLGADITYNPQLVDANGENYTAIGYNSSSDSKFFMGNFDGRGHTVSGIRINNNCDYQGLFAMVINGTVKNVTVSDMHITGSDNVGGIMGKNNGTIENCHATATVSINPSNNDCMNFGGIVGNNIGTIRSCTSSATVTLYRNGGGIAGINNNGKNTGIIENCLVVGAEISGDFDVGAIVGCNAMNSYHQFLSIISNNYYHGCIVTVGDNSYTENIGVGDPTLTDISSMYIGYNSSVTYTNGAVPGYMITLCPGLTSDALSVGGYHVAASGATVTLSAPGYTITAASYNDGTNHEITPDNGVYSFQMPASNVTVTATWNVEDWATVNEGSKDNPYMIYNKDQLDLLAQRVNSGNTYEDKYFLQGADITYDGTENNYTPIGNTSHYFCGHYNGGGYTISGININGISNDVGLFGYVYNPGTVENVTLANSTLKGFMGVGGIVGNMNGDQYDPDISNCRVESNVTIGTGKASAANHGGIVGTLQCGIISGCVSAASITNNGYNSCQQYGGIVGYISSNVTAVENCLYTGHTVTASSKTGAIVGAIYYNNSTLTTNYYISDNVPGGVNSQDKNGACRGYTVTLDDGITCDAFTIGGYTVAPKDQKLTLSFNGTAPAGCEFKGYSVNGTSISGNTFTMPASNVTVTATWKKLLTNTDITIDAIADQAWNDGNAITPAVTVKDGTTDIGSECDFAYTNNQNTGTATVTITAKTTSTSYSGSTSTTFKIVPKVVLKSGAVQILDNQDGLHGIIDGNYSGTEAVSISGDIEVQKVTFNRTFPTEGCCTLVLPCEVYTDQLTGVSSVYIFRGVKKDGDTWVVDVYEEWKLGENHIPLSAYKPYIVKMNSSSLGISASSIIYDDRATLFKATSIESNHDYRFDNWEFRGIYSYTVWNQGHADLGRVYGFAATAVSEDGIKIGDFVRAEAGAYIYPFRACLYYDGTDSNWDKSSQARRHAMALDELPDRIPVRIVNADEADGVNEVNASLEVNGVNDDCWFTLDGRKLGGKPAKAGLYINGGCKVAIK